MSTNSSILRSLYSHIPAKKLSTARPVSRDDVKLAIRSTKDAKRRVRVYSDMGFVPGSYKWRCDIQYVECIKSGNKWSVHVGWTGASRRGGIGNLCVVQ